MSGPLADNQAVPTSYAITVLGHDRPGIIAETTGHLADLGLNIEDSTMTLLRGHFAMMLICRGPASAARIEESLAPLVADGSLTVSVREVPDEDEPEMSGEPWILTVHGGDRPGIVSSVMAELARAGGNVTDLTTRLSGDLYLLIAEVDLPESADVAAVRDAISRVAERLDVVATLRPADADEL